MPNTAVDKAANRIFDLTITGLDFTFHLVVTEGGSRTVGDVDMVCRMVKVLLLLLGGLSMSSSIGVASDTLPAPPVAKVVPKVIRFMEKYALITITGCASATILK